MSFWDSLIVAAALGAGVEILYSEELQHGLNVDDGLRVLNPFQVEGATETSMTREELLDLIY